MSGNVEEQNLGKASLGLLFFAVFMDLFGFGIIVPILPNLVRKDFGGSGLEYGLIISLFSLMQFIFAPIWGKISDTKGRRPVILIGLFGSIIGFAIFGLANNLYMLYLARIVAGIFTAATLTTANAYIADTTPPEKRGEAYGIIVAAFGLGFALGPGVGGILSDMTILGMEGHLLNGMFASFLCLLNFIGAVFLLPESLDEETKQQNGKKEKTSFFSISEFKRVTEGTRIPLYTAIFAFVSFGFSMIIAAFAVYALEADNSVNDKKLGYYFMYAGFVLFFSQRLLTKPLTHRFGENTVIKIGIFGLLLGFVLLPVMPSFLFMAGSNTFFLLGVSLVNPGINSAISKLSKKENQGVVMGFNQSFASLMRVVGPIIAGALFDVNIHFPFYFGTFVILAVIILVQTKLTDDEIPVVRISSHGFSESLAE